MVEDKEGGLGTEQRRAIIEELEEILNRLDKAGETLAAINIDLALNLLSSERPLS